MIGQTIGNYVVTREVGRGGMGAVYLAEHPRISKQVAVKVLLPEFGNDPSLVQRFFTEAQSATAIKNEHIIDVIDFGESADGQSYIVMEWLEGKSLGDVIDHESPLPLARVLHIVDGIADALDAAHAKGIVHRDLKPDNIFLVTRQGDEDFVKVLDFGVAKLMKQHADPAVPGRMKTETGALIGTPSYMSPEQCRGHDIDARSDIYALGVIVYELLTRRLPFNAQGLGDLLLAHMMEEPVAPRTFAPEIPESVELAILCALEKDRERRFQNAKAFAAALRGELDVERHERHAPTARVNAVERKAEQRPGLGGREAGKQTIAAVQPPGRPAAGRLPIAVLLGAVAIAAVIAWAVLRPTAAPIAQPAPVAITPPPTIASSPPTPIVPPPTIAPSPPTTSTPAPTIAPSPPTEKKVASKPKLPAPPPATAEAKPDAKPATKPTTTKPTPTADGKPVYTGKKGTLVTEFPE